MAVDLGLRGADTYYAAAACLKASLASLGHDQNERADQAARVESLEGM